MALTAATVFDLIAATQTITFSNPAQVDQITYSGNQITFQTSSTYNLSQSDFALYVKYVLAFNILLIQNFPQIPNSYILEWSPLSIFSITQSNVGVEHITYNQSSNGTQVININYVPIATSAAFATRGSPVTIPLQEWFTFIVMMQQYATQVALN